MYLALFAIFSLPFVVNGLSFANFVDRAHDCDTCFNDSTKVQCFQRTAECVKKFEPSKHDQFLKDLRKKFGVSSEVSLQISAKALGSQGRPVATKLVINGRNSNRLLLRAINLFERKYGKSCGKLRPIVRSNGQIVLISRCAVLFKRFYLQYRQSSIFGDVQQEEVDVWQKDRPRPSKDSAYCEGISALYLPKSALKDWCVVDKSDVLLIITSGFGNWLGDELHKEDGFILGNMTAVVTHEEHQSGNAVTRARNIDVKPSRWESSMKVIFHSWSRARMATVEKVMGRVQKRDKWKNAFHKNMNRYNISRKPINKNRFRYSVIVPFSREFMNEIN